MAIVSKLNFTKSWNSPVDFPTYEESEIQVRADMQFLYDEIRDYLNNTLVPILQSKVDEVRVSSVALKQEEDGPHLLVTLSSGEVVDAGSIQTQIVPGPTGVGIADIGFNSETNQWIITYTDDTVVTLPGPSFEKMAEAFKVFVSMDTPGAAQNPDTGHRIGRQWLRPAYVVENKISADWSMTGGTVTADGADRLIAPDGTASQLQAANAMAGIGSPGDRIFVSVQASELDAHLTLLTLTLGSSIYDLTDGGGVYETVLGDNGNLELLVTASWSYSSDPAEVRLGKLAVVNATAVENSLTDCDPLSDWGAFLAGYAPFSKVMMPRAMFVQSAPGEWAVTDREVLPVSRGGTGLDSLAQNRYLKTNSDGTFGFLSKEDVILDLGQLRLMQGTYTGTGAARSLTLPVTPKLLVLHRATPRGTVDYRSSLNYLVPDMTPAVLTDGADALLNEMGRPNTNSEYGHYLAGVKLSGNTVSFFVAADLSSGGKADYMNCSGITYGWTALY